LSSSFTAGVPLVTGIGFWFWWWLLCCEISFPFSCKKPLGEFLPQGFLSTDNRTLNPLPFRNPQGRQQLQMLPALWISRNFVKKEKREKKYL